MDLKIIEITQENKKKYIDQLEKLEANTVQDTKKDGKIVSVDRKRILQYIESSNDIVLCSLDLKNKITSFVYLLQNQLPFTLNDNTKYFKYSDQYKEYIKSNIGDNYGLRMMQIYNLKLQAFDFAKRKILELHPEYKDEKNISREEINKYMSLYMKKINALRLYEKFYWISLSDIIQKIGKKLNDVNIKKDDIIEYENFLESQKLDIKSFNLDNQSKYFNCNTSNTIQIDTYVTTPKCRYTGLAKILVYEGIKKKILQYFENESNKELYLSSTFYKDNIASKYVSEFFELEDNISVNNNCIEKTIHICCIERENYKKYLNEIKDKLIVLYNYNPTDKKISKRRKEEIIKKQLEYERKQYIKINKIRNNTINYKGQLEDIMPKLYKIGKLKQMLKQLNQNEEIGDNR